MMVAHTDTCKWCKWWSVVVVVWCSVQSGGQRHILVHHLERLCKCDHTREGKSIHCLQKIEIINLRIVNRQMYCCLGNGSWNIVMLKAPCAHTGPGDYTTWRRGLWAAGFAEWCTSRCDDHLKRRQLPFPPRWQTGLHTHPQGMYEYLITSIAFMWLGLFLCVRPKFGSVNKYAFDLVVFSFRMLKPTQCDFKSTGKLCWCWRRALIGPSREEPDAIASEKLWRTHLWDNATVISQAAL